MDQYEVKQNSVDVLLGLVRQCQVAIPELQRPCVWNSTKVRDLLDSIFEDYPAGYLITWQSPGAALKDGSTASYQQILIDGQQRITALGAAIASSPLSASAPPHRNAPTATPTSAGALSSANDDSTSSSATPAG